MGYKIEQRYRFGDFALHRVLPAVYFEYKNERDTHAEIEGKLIVEYRPSSDQIVSFNLIAEGDPDKIRRPEMGYSLGYAHLKAIPDHRFWVGFETFGNWSEKRHWAGPTIGFAPNDNLRFVLTYGKAYRGDVKDQAQVLVSYEFK